jgi:hypothetical protein
MAVGIGIGEELDLEYRLFASIENQLHYSKN